jgi:hypothetical protein
MDGNSAMLAELNGADSDLLSVSGDAAVGGALRVKPVGGFAAITKGDTFTVAHVTGEITVADANTVFDEVLGCVLKVGGVDQVAVIDGNDIVVTATYMGDATREGQVSAADLSLLADNWGKSGRQWEQADFTGDGEVGPADLSLLADNWNAGVTGAPAAVPEPGSALILVTLGAAAFVRRRARR